MSLEENLVIQLLLKVQVSAILQKNIKDFSLLIYRYISSRRDWENSKLCALVKRTPHWCSIQHPRYKIINIYISTFKSSLTIVAQEFSLVLLSMRIYTFIFRPRGSRVGHKCNILHPFLRSKLILNLINHKVT